MKKLNVRHFGVGSLMKYAPLFSLDTKYVFTIGDSCVHIWSIKTGECIRQINQAKADNSPIVGICINPTNRLQLCIGEQNGLINVWDYEDGILIHTIQFDFQILNLVSIQNNYIYLICRDKNGHSLRMLKSIRPTHTTSIVQDKLPCIPKHLSFDLKGELCSFIDDNGTILYILQIKANSQSYLKQHHLKKANLQLHKKLTCCTTHPTEQCIATGTQNGQICLWYNFLDRAEPTISFLHWHSLPVICLAFSPEGSYLLSGGHECVLVKWFYRTSQTTFRPRLGAPLLHIQCSQDQTTYAITHEDNSLHIIGSNFTIQQTIGGLNNCFLSKQSDVQAGIHIFNRQHALVMNGKPGHLQFISTDDGKLLYNLDIVGENYVSSNEYDEQPIFTDVKRMVFDSTETWLTTFEECFISPNENNNDLSVERKLRFWLFNQTNMQFQLNTSISYPHSQDTIAQILFHPTQLEFISIGHDGFFKIWNYIDENIITKRAAHWRCVNAYSHRSYSGNSLCYSLDGSLLACGFDHILTVWNSPSKNEDYELLNVYSHFDSTNKIKSLHFSLLNLYKDHIFVCHESCVNIWNVTKHVFIQTYNWNVQAITMDPKSKFIAIFEKNYLHFFSFDGKIQTKKNPLFKRVTACRYIPYSQQSTSSYPPIKHSKLVFYIPGQGLKCLDDHSIDENGKSALIKSSLNQETASTIAAIIQNSRGEKREITKLFYQGQITNDNEQLLSTPAYLLPSIDLYCTAALKRMLIPVQKTQQHEKMITTSDGEEIENGTDDDHLSTMSVDEDIEQLET